MKWIRSNFYNFVLYDVVSPTLQSTVVLFFQILFIVYGKLSGYEPVTAASAAWPT